MSMVLRLGDLVRTKSGYKHRIFSLTHTTYNNGLSIFDCTRLPHIYRVGDTVLTKHFGIGKITCVYEGITGFIYALGRLRQAAYERDIWCRFCSKE